MVSHRARSFANHGTLSLARCFHSFAFLFITVNLFSSSMRPSFTFSIGFHSFAFAILAGWSNAVPLGYALLLDLIADARSETNGTVKRLERRER